ncbi:hypothetical protein DUI87_25333 [Hirundo rustica rustica]|uniref:Uncharacterized protein n=1 Tax=Hirundo rustica rustica TaxID=333673 RepID=A0A3M0JA88_HIRRU|nr:hypothetical protein DUI87_25333 [Hirundo rustica rustica]
MTMVKQGVPSWPMGIHGGSRDPSAARGKGAHAKQEAVIRWETSMDTWRLASLGNTRGVMEESNGQQEMYPGSVHCIPLAHNIRAILDCTVELLRPGMEGTRLCSGIATSLATPDANKA